nr:putative ribonuclease H-like domain-containing protein [Tanacetum cinerariifolium]
MLIPNYQDFKIHDFRYSDGFEYFQAIKIGRNKKVERGIVVRNKARLVAQGHTQEEGINYKEVFDPVARIEAIRLFLACASFMGFMVYQMDVKSAFLYGTIGEEVYVGQLLGFKDPDHPDKVYKVVKALYGLHQALRACLDRKSTTGGCQFLGCRLISWQCKKQTVVATLSKETHKPKKPTRNVTEVPQPSDPMEHVANEAIHKELGDNLVRAATTASSLEAKEDSGNINKT